MHPVPVCDTLSFSQGTAGLELSCNQAELPVDSRNLVHRAATAFLGQARVNSGVRIHLEKRLPLAAGLGGGSGNAATTLLGLNELFGGPLSGGELHSIAASLGSDIPFFLQAKPALATGRGEQVQPMDRFETLRGKGIFLVHPGFGISTPWAYRQLAHFPKALNGTPGRAGALVAALRQGDLLGAAADFYNSLEAPALHKYPVLSLYQEFLRDQGALMALMSGSGSTTFAIFEDLAGAKAAMEPFRARFGSQAWMVAETL